MIKNNRKKRLKEREGNDLENYVLLFIQTDPQKA